MPMQVQLPPETESIVRALVEAGEYRDQDYVIAEAIRLLDNARQRRELLAALAIAQSRIERGEYVLFTPELRDAIRREARQMAAEDRAPHLELLP